jgi:threonine dehydrogenase-like Zn-dependent dehydrogenase
LGAAEYARVPYADFSLISLPVTGNTTSRALEQDYLTVSDIFSTAWTALDFAGFQSGETVAIFGAGPVGLLAVHSAFLRGASRVYIIDHVQMRLDRAASIGAIPINFVATDPVAQILASEPGGVMRSIDCVGIEAVNAKLQPDEGIVVRQMIDITHFGGGIGQVGIWRPQESSAGAPRGSTLSANLSFPLSSVFSKQLSWKSGPVDPKPVSPYLVTLIQRGIAKPNFITSAEIGIEDVPDYYKRFDEHDEIKVFIHFP